VNSTDLIQSLCIAGLVVIVLIQQATINLQVGHLKDLAEHVIKLGDILSARMRRQYDNKETKQ